VKHLESMIMHVIEMVNIHLVNAIALKDNKVIHVVARSNVRIMDIVMVISVNVNLNLLVLNVNIRSINSSINSYN